MEAKSHKVYTLIVPIDLERRRVLLGYKRRGFGAGKYNGFGGKVEASETIPEGAARELEEESFLKVALQDLTQQGVLLLETIKDNSLPVLEIHLFTVTKWQGTETETEEMTPIWFSALPEGEGAGDLEAVPYDKMWEETPHWLPPLLLSMFGKDEEREKRPADYFVHHVWFEGGMNKETGEEDVWHGMRKRELEWVSQLPDFRATK